MHCTVAMLVFLVASLVVAMAYGVPDHQQLEADLRAGCSSYGQSLSHNSLLKMSSEYIEISTKVGKLKGLVKKSLGRREITYHSFQGIPYAKPPIGNLRFKAPKPYGRWKSTRDATKEGNDCIQIKFQQQQLVGDEDCLYLNVYSPQKPLRSLKQGPKKAVMVWIHGGGFARGSGSTELYGPELLIAEDIVLVTINYRCGALGFLSLENKPVPGNAGLKDQSLALKWVRDNISSFGGNPYNVTIFGESAGASSVNYHLLSPLSRGLFHKAILQSGTSVCQWAFQNKPWDKALLLASKLGCTSKDKAAVLQCLMTAPASEIVNVQESETFTTEKEKIQKLGLSFIPSVEVAGAAPFLTDYPRKLLEKGKFHKVPVIMGVTDAEGLIVVGVNEIIRETVNKIPSLLVPSDLHIPPGSEEEKALGREILRFYSIKDTNTLSSGVDAIKGLVDFITDTAFSVANQNTRESFLRHMKSPVYSYVFSFKSSWTIVSHIVKQIFPDLNDQLFDYGACHADDLGHLFRVSFQKSPPSADDVVFSNKLLRAWSTFAKTGNPNCPELGVTWKPDNIAHPNFLDLGKTFKVTNGTFVPKRLQFWKKIYDKYSYLY